MSHTLQLPFRNSLLWALGRPDVCLKRVYYTIRNSLIWISSKYTSFGGNCNKISFSNLPALKTPVNRHPIGCHTRYTCHSEILYFAPSRARPDFCLKRFPQSQGKAPWGRGCYRMSHKLQSPFRNSLLWALGRPEFCFQSFYYTIRNSLMWISLKYTSFGGNCNKISFANLPALKTPVNRHPIGCHTRYTRHLEIL